MGIERYFDKVKEGIERGTFEELLANPDLYSLPYENVLYPEETACILSAYIDDTKEDVLVARVLNMTLRKWLREGSEGIYKAYVVASGIIKMETKGFVKRMLNNKTRNLIIEGILHNVQTLRTDSGRYCKDVSYLDSIIKRGYFTTQVFKYGVSGTT